MWNSIIIGCVRFKNKIVVTGRLQLTIVLAIIDWTKIKISDVITTIDGIVNKTRI